MGNSGSVHNLNWDSNATGLSNGRSKSELNGYLQRSRDHYGSTQDNETQTQTLLRRQHNHSSQKMDRSKPGFPGAASAEQFKVLPKIDADRRKLRPTTNGMLLHAGGTISGRHKEELRGPGLMQRSRTFIIDQRKGDEDEDNSTGKVAIPSFQRSQTLLHLSYKDRDHDEDRSSSRKSSSRKIVVKENGEAMQRGIAKSSNSMRHALSEPDFRNDLNRPTHARKTGLMDNANVPATATLTKTTKLNKYNKKRKAPPAPSTGTGEQSAASKLDSSETAITEKAAPVTRRFRTNINIKSQQSQQSSQLGRQQQTTPHHQSHHPAPIYRRERSCDAILLRSKDETVRNMAEKRSSLGSRLIESRQQSLRKESYPTIVAAQSKQSSKIPQLKRTFYFGMQTTPTTEDSRNMKEKFVKAKDVPITENHNKDLQIRKSEKETKQDQIKVVATPDIISDDIKEINALTYHLVHSHGNNGHNIDDDHESRTDDNGILVHVRPSLPRRQLEVPSFSPAAAWRMLPNFEEQRRKHLTTPKSSTNDTLINCESPIQLRSTKLALELEELRQEERAPPVQKTLRDELVHGMTWTPQQDLGDDDDDDEDNVDNNDINNEANIDTSSSDDLDGAKDEEDGLLFFNGSQAKTNDEKNSLGVHMFSLSLPRDLDTQTQKKILLASNDRTTTGFSSLQKLKLSISGGSRCTCKNSFTKFPVGNMEVSTELNPCEIHSNPIMFRSDNWVLHKTGTKDGASNSLTNDCGKLLKDDIKPIVEPISLSYLTGGKHIMYLPGMAPTSRDIGIEERQRKETTPTRDPLRVEQRPRQRKKDTRESLQDETPILRHHQQHQTHIQQTQRFSFQSTVRLLEKRRLAEKLSRDAEIREAQRKSELEAMKRVEEDFQRKRASEKANIRHQLRLYCGGSNGNDINASNNTLDQYNSLPVFSSSRQHHHDSNNNKISARRADPDGAASSPSPPFVIDTEPLRFVHQISHLPLKRRDSDFADINAVHLNNRSASMIEPYKIL